MKLKIKKRNKKTRLAIKKKKINNHKRTKKITKDSWKK